MCPSAKPPTDCPRDKFTMPPSTRAPRRCPPIEAIAAHVAARRAKRAREPLPPSSPGWRPAWCPTGCRKRRPELCPNEAPRWGTKVARSPEIVPGNLHWCPEMSNVGILLFWVQTPVPGSGARTCFTSDSYCVGSATTWVPENDASARKCCPCCPEMVPNIDLL